MRKSDPSDVSDASDIFSISFPYARAQEQELENVSDASEVSGTIVLMAQNERCSVLHCANKQLIRGTTMPIFLQVFLPYALMNMRDCRFPPDESGIQASQGSHNRQGRSHRPEGWRKLLLSLRRRNTAAVVFGELASL